MASNEQVTVDVVEVPPLLAHHLGLEEPSTNNGYFVQILHYIAANHCCIACIAALQCCKSRVISPAFKCFTSRILPLATAVWMVVDMALDGLQAYNYYQAAFNPNGTFSRWANVTADASNSTHIETVSPAYFYVSMVIFSLTPLVFWLYRVFHE